MTFKKRSVDRRTILKTTGAGVGGSIAVAGCLDSNGDDGDDATEEIEEWLDEEPTRLDAIAEDEIELEGGPWDGEVVDETGADEVSIDFSAPLEVDGEMLGPFAIDPWAVDISPEATVLWEWQGEHTLTSYFDPPHENPGDAAEDEFEVPGEEEELTTHEHTFEEPGVYLYYCLPHGTPYETEQGPAGTDGASNWFGHRGAIRVVDD
ncbi:cupredoxin domain-containing protein [Halorubrum vacuolatum]|uniref:Plastocyanin n=1 Tax=Halorubrum vacuolatum TaxID=63740 RepID=A0A238VLE8_HALVU|nr:halocyanin [Halorubrum vacuolatum]SNR35028.1 Plastocyanin [Halorubrum vacuolatum]